MRKTSEERCAQLLKAGAQLAGKYGPGNVTRRMIAKKCKVAEPLVTRYLGPKEVMRKAITRMAETMQLKFPSEAEQEAIGARLRRAASHGGKRKGAGRPPA